MIEVLFKLFLSFFINASLFSKSNWKRCKEINIFNLKKKIKI